MGDDKLTALERALLEMDGGDSDDEDKEEDEYIIDEEYELLEEEEEEKKLDRLRKQVELTELELRELEVEATTGNFLS